MAFSLDPSSATTPSVVPEVITDDITIGDTDIPGTAYMMPSSQGGINQVPVLTDKVSDPAQLTYQNIGTIPCPVITADPAPAVLNCKYYCDTSGGSFTVTLPGITEITNGAMMVFIDSTGSFGANPLTIQAGTNTSIDSGALNGTFVLSQTNAAIEFLYDSSQNNWVLVGSVGSISSGINLGAMGQEVFKQVSAGQMQFRKIHPASTKVTMSTASDVIMVDVAENQINHDNLLGFQPDEHFPTNDILPPSPFTLWSSDKINTEIQAVDKDHVGLSEVENIKSEFGGITFPNSNDDALDGFAEGSLWVDTVNNEAYINVDPTAAAADWKCITCQGEDNTGSSVGGTAAVFKQKMGVNLEFRGVSSTSGAISVGEAANDVQLTLNENQVDHNSLQNYDVNQHRTINDVGTGLTDLWSANKITAELAGKAATAHTHVAADVTDFNTAADARITAQKGMNNGIAELDGTGKVPTAQLPISGLSYKGVWDANTDTPTLPATPVAAGDYYIVSVAGSTSKNGITDWSVGDWIIGDGTPVWQKIDNTDQVVSVAGKQGVVVLDAADITGVATFANALIASSNVTQHQGDITGTGALDSGSITGNFGNIDNSTGGSTIMTTSLMVGDGTSGAPAMKFSDATSGLYRSAVNEISVSTTGVQRVKVEANGTLAVTTANYETLVTADDDVPNKKYVDDEIAALALGETNTASNQGTAGVGVFKQKTGVDLEFRNVNAASSKVTVALDAANNEIDIDVDPSQINHNALMGYDANRHFLQGEIVATGALNAGSITSGFGNIDNGASSVTTGNLSVANGSNAVPSVRWTASANTGLYSSATDEISVTNMGNQTFKFESNGTLAATTASYETLVTDPQDMTNKKYVDDYVATNGGEDNTASNQGTGVGVFDNKNVADLEFRSLVAASSKVSIALDGPNKEIDIDVAEANIDHDALLNYSANEHYVQSAIVQTGALNSGSITSGFGSIDNGASSITTTGALSGGVVSASTGVLTAAGAVGTPSIAFTADSNTGLYSSGADELSVATNGTRRFTVEADGTLSVAGTSNYETLVTADDDIPNKKFVDDSIAALNLGEDNTASNQGTTGVGLFDAKNGIDLEFRNVAPASAKVTVTLDAPNKDVEIDVVDAQIDHNSLLNYAANRHYLQSEIVATGAVDAGSITGNFGNINNAVGGSTVTTAGVTVNAGTAGAPALSFAGDAASGLYQQGAGQVALAAGGLQRLAVNVDGSLTVAGTTNYEALVTDDDDLPNKKFVDDAIAALNLGEDNTASNQGTTGVGVFDNKNGVDLEFRHIAPASAKVTVSLDAPNKDVEIDVVDAQIDHDALLNYAANEHYLQSAIVETGALNAGSITAGFGSINNGASSISTTGSMSGGNVSATTAFLAAAGAVGAPSITFAADNNTGIYSSGTDELSVATNGTQRLTVEANGTLNVAGTTDYETLVTADDDIPNKKFVDDSIAALSLGETNTASNQGAGVGVFDNKNGVDLEFRSLVAASSKVTIALDAGNKEVDIDVAEAQIDHDALLNYAANEHYVQSAIVETGALNSGSITSGFGAINNGASGITSTGAISGATVSASSAFLAAAGLAGTPSISFTGDADTGLYNSATNELSVATNGTQRLTVEADGTLNVAGTTDYETLVTADDDIPNKKFVDDSIAALDLGEDNTASNVGTAGVGVFKQKTGVDLEFRNVNAGSSKVTVTLDGGDNEIDIDVAEAQIDHDALLNYAANEHFTQAQIVATGAVDSGSITGNFGNINNATGGSTVTTAGVVVNAGTALLPSVSITGDANTGLYQPAADQLAVATAGVQRLLFEDDGTLSVIGTPNYEVLVTADDDVPNKKYVDDFVNNQKGAANGLATLDGSGKVPASQLALSNVDYQGTWNANTNTPTLVSATGTQGHYYVVSVAGTTNLDGITDWQVNDWVIYNGSAWEKVDNTDQVTSVAGKQGAVVLDANDITGVATFADALIAASNVTQHQGSLTGTGALNSGSITSGFGAINNGASGITSTGAISGANVSATTAFLAAAGAAATPSVAFTADTDTGLYNSATNELSVATNGTRRLTVEADGTLNVAGTTDYETLVTADDDIPNKKFVDDSISALSLGETNTASNVGVGGVAVFKQKAGVDFEFRSINAASSKVTVALDGPNNEVDIDVAEAQIDHDALLNYVAGEHYLQSAIVETGALNSGSITSGFGNINIGTSTFDTTGIIRGGHMWVENGRVYTGPGSNSSPSFAFFADTNTGFYNSAANEISLSTNGVQRWKVEADGTMVVTTTDYETLVTADDDIPNKKFVDDAIAALSLGETNTVSNQGAGIGVFDNKNGVDFELRSLVAASSKVTIALDAGNKEIDIDVAEAQIDHDALLNYVAGEHYLQSAIVETGALNSGSITSGFGSINNGASGITTTGALDGATVSASTAFRSAAGSMAAPAFSFTADTNTGMYASGTDELSLVTGGMSRLTVESNGTLNVAGTTNYEALVTDDDDVPNKKFVDDSIAALDLGEDNTASNQGAGIGVFDNKNVADLEFRSLVAASSKVSISLDGPNKEIDIDVVEAQIDHDALTNYSASEHFTQAQIVETGALNSGSITSGFGNIDNGSSTITTTGNVTGGRLLAPAGTVGAPSIAVSTDLNTGLYQPAVDQLAVATGGVQRLLIEDNGTLSVAGTTDYETLVTADDDVPNKKFVDDSIAALSLGETNTSSNQGAGVGVFDNKNGVDFEFRSLVAASSKLTIALDAGNKEIDIDVDPAAIDHDALLNYAANEHFTQAQIVATGAVDSGSITGNFGNIDNSTGGSTVTTTGVTVAAGTAVAPSIAISGDSNTGLYAPAADQLAITTAGIQRLLVEDNGTLSVAGTSNYETLVTADDDIPNKKFVDDAITAIVDDGENNTASNVGTAGVGVFKQKTGVDLEFRNVNAGSSKISVVLDGANNEIDIDLVEANIVATGALNSGSITSGFGNIDVGASAVMAGCIVGGLGTALLPSHTFTGDLNTGMYSPGADQVAFASAGVQRLLIEANGTLSVIGTTDYETLVTADDDIPNKKYVDDEIAGLATGETNTASNVGAAGVNVFKQKTGVDFEFRSINAASSKISVALDGANDEVDIDLVQGNITGTGTLTSGAITNGFGNITNSGGFNMTTDRFRGVAGTTALPMFTSLLDTDTGMTISANQCIFSAGGTQRFTVRSTDIRCEGVPIHTDFGSAAAPGHSFYSDSDTGMFRLIADTLSFATGGSNRMNIMSTGVIRAVTSDYETLVTGDDDIPNKKYVDDFVNNQKGAANGLATLDGSGKVPASQLSLTNVVYQGTWNATTNTPTLTGGSGTQGHYYVVSVAGSTNLDGITDWQIGDWAIYNGTAWEKVDNTDLVTSVAGKTGAVTLDNADVGLGNVTNIKHNFTATAPPAATDDSPDGGYQIGSLWVNTNTGQSWICRDATDDAAIWDQHTQIRNITTTDPTTGDDVNDDYYIGNIWINTSTDNVFFCLDNTATAAVWICIVGEVNTGSSLGGTVNVFKQKTSSNLEFRGISAGSTKISLTENANDIDIDVVPGNISHTGLADIGSNTHAQIDTHISDTSIHYTQASIVATGALDSGSITGNFGNINNATGNNNVTTDRFYGTSGTTALPMFTSVLDPDSGLTISGNICRLCTGGSPRLSVSNTDIRVEIIPFRVANGTPSVPTLSFYNDTDTGFYRLGADLLAVSAGGSTAMSWSTTTITCNKPLAANVGSAATPGIHFSTDSDTGMFRSAVNAIGFATAGTERLEIEADGTLNVSGTTDYETLVTADDDIPNKKYVDDTVTASVPTSVSVSTTDATVTTIHTVATTSDNAYGLDIKITGLQDTGATGAFYSIKAAYRNDGGTVSQISTEQRVEFEDTAAWDVSHSISGTNILVRVTGVAATNIDWKGTVSVTSTE